MKDELNNLNTRNKTMKVTSITIQGDSGKEATISLVDKLIQVEVVDSEISWSIQSWFATKSKVMKVAEELQEILDGQMENCERNVQECFEVINRFAD